MSFLDIYVEKYALPEISEGVKKRLEQVENRLEEISEGENTFEEIIQDYSEEISNLVLRMKKEFKDWKFNVGNVVSSFRFILDIGQNVAVIIDEISAKIVPDNATPEEARQLKIKFGQELTYFIYLLWDPRLVKWIPVGIETWAEKKIVYWLAAMVVDKTLDFLEKPHTVAKKRTFVEKKVIKKRKTKKQ